MNEFGECEACAAQPGAPILCGACLKRRAAANRPDAEETRRRWRQLEADAARAIGGNITPGSGNQGVKGDCVSSQFRVECKSYWSWDPGLGYYVPLQLIWLETIWTYARKEDQLPVLVLEWGDGQRRALVPAHHPDVQVYVREESSGNGLWPGRSASLPCLPAGKLLSFPDLRVVDVVWLLLTLEDLAQLRSELQPGNEQKGGFTRRDQPGRVGEVRFGNGSKIQTGAAGKSGLGGGKLRGSSPWGKRGFRS